MDLLNSVLRYAYMLCILTLTIVQSQSFYPFPLPKRGCCTTITRQATVQSAPSPIQRAPELTDLMKIVNEHERNYNLQAETDPLTAAAEKFALPKPPPFMMNDSELKELESQKAYICSKISCSQQLKTGPVCACNFKTGNVVTFKNQCDLRKHNCRFETEFKVILHKICPWEFESRRRPTRRPRFEYKDSKYYNK